MRFAAFCNVWFVVAAFNVPAQGVTSCSSPFEQVAKVVSVSGRTLYADLDRDGLVEPVVSDGYAAQVFRNRGSGFFAPAHRIDLNHAHPSLQGTVLLAITDMNGDAHQDLVFTRTGFVGVLLGYGDGTFSTKAVSYDDTASADWGVWVLADLSGDGLPDLVAMARSRLLVVVYRDGSLQLASEIVVVPPDYLNDDVRWSTGDFDGDGREDIVVAAFHRRTRRWDWLFYWSEGALPFTESIVTSLPAPPYRISAVDVDADGRQEIAGTTTDELLVVSVDRRVATARTFPVDLLQKNARFDAVADADENGWNDLIFAAGFGAGVIWGSDAGFTHVSYVSVAEGQDSVRVFDINGDSRLDLVLGRAVAFGKGQRAFAAPARYPLVATGERVFRADVNEDGLQDAVVTSSSSNGAVEVLFATDRGFRRGVDKRFGFFVDDDVAAVADFDGDRHVDVALKSGTSGKVYFGDGATLGTSSTLALETGSLAGLVLLRAGEPNVLINRVGQLLQAVRITSGRTAVSTPLVTLDAGEGFRFFDADGDGDSDLLLSLGDVHRLLENRFGSFQEPRDIIRGSSVDGATAGDLDGDGYSELLLWSSLGNYTVYRRGAGSGYEPTFHGTTFPFPGAIHITDWDRDGRHDLVMVSIRDNQRRSFVDLQWNVGGRFESVATTVVADSGGAGYVSDVDGDGWSDLVVLTQFGLEVVRNHCPPSAPRTRRRAARH